MIGLWMARALLTSALLAVAALAVERAVMALGGSRRWPWTGALVLAMALALASWLTPDLLPGPALVHARGPLVERAVDTLLRAGAPVVASPAVGVSGDVVLAIIWTLAAFAAICLYAAGMVRMRRARRAWRSESVAGATVLVSPRIGPAAIGLLQPAIVVPEWLLSVDERLQRLVLLHEVEHLRARDHLVLALAPLVVVLMPWNLACWWMLRRLRVAVEMDCDRRVLARGVDVSSYGSLLIDVAGMDRIGLFSTALAPSRSSLERRIVALTAGLPSWGAGRALAWGTAGLFLMAMACAAIPPVREAQAGDAMIAALESMLSSRSSDLGFRIDGRPASADEVRGLPRVDIAQVLVRRGTSVIIDGGATDTTVERTVDVHTRGHEGNPAIDGGDAGNTPHPFERSELARLSERIRQGHADILIDGRRSNVDQLGALERSNRIVSVEVQQREGPGDSRIEVRARTRR
jgi:hypothetical protein